MTEPFSPGLRPADAPMLWMAVPARLETEAFARIIGATSGAGIHLCFDLVSPRPGELDALVTNVARAGVAGKAFVRLFLPTAEAIRDVIRLGSRLAGVWLPIDPLLEMREARAGAPPEAREPLFGTLIERRADWRRLPTDLGLPPIVRGNETAGVGGPLGTLAAFQVARRLAPGAFLIDGGFDIPGAAAIIAAGAGGAVVSGAVWAFPECGERLSSLAKAVRAHEATRICDGRAEGFRFAARPKADLDGIRKSIAGLPLGHWPSLLPIGAHAMGQDAEFGRGNLQRWNSLADCLAQARSAVERQPEKRFDGFPADSPITRELGCRHPLIQGPMARISDRPEFLAAIARAGAMPVAALASLPPEECRRLLEACHSLGVEPGIGIIGLDLMAELVSAQLSVVEEVAATTGRKPPFILVAAPSPGLVERLVKAGHRVVAHAPHLPALHELFEVGCRWFIFEGCESGGHIGRVSSLILWQQVLSDLAVGQSEPARSLDQLRLIFAGGLAERSGVEFLAALIDAYGLSGRVAWGIQIGTALLATREVVESGAMSANYRRWILEGEETLVTGETLGLRARQVATPFVAGILAREAAMLAEGLPLTERRHRFEADNLGNLARAAASKDGEDGCFMAGEIIAAIEEETDLESLFERLCGPVGAAASSVEDPTETDDSGADRRSSDGAGETRQRPTNEPIAIIGMGCLFPGSANPRQLFANVLARRSFIRTMPVERLDPNVYYSSDPATPMATYSRIGGFLDEIPFDPTVFKVPPRVADKLDAAQKLSLIVARQALADAGLLERPFDRERCAVMVGNSMGGSASVDNLRAVHFHEFVRRLAKAGEEAGIGPLQERLLGELTERLGLPQITEDSLPGELGSLIAGRVAAVFDLHGPNFTLDAACGSSLAAVIIAVQALRQGQIDLALAGGVDTQMDPGSFIKFSKVTALSARGSFPFDHRADGFVMAEGAGMVLLKRLSDALRDGDPIDAVILGVGQSSDGRGKGITAPNPDGQRRAIERAWNEAGHSFEEAAYIEAHGTGTVVGDEIELRTIASLLPPGKRVAVGSVKAMIGHAKAAAGIAGLLKAAWTVNRRVIPPQAGYERFPESWGRADLPVTIPTEERPWTDGPLYVGVSSFGFGGTNHHLVLGEPPRQRRERNVTIADAAPQPEAPIAVEKTAEAGSEKPIVRPAVNPSAIPAIAPGESRSPGKVDCHARPGLIAAVFPGQGSQYLGMLAAWREEPRFAGVLREAEAQFAASENGVGSLTEIIYPPAGAIAQDTDRERAVARLQNTLVAQPAILAVSVALLEVARARGFRFDCALGHSLGEYSALYAAGALSFREILQTVCIRARYMATLPAHDLGAMGVVAMPAAEVEPVLATIPGYVAVANLNSPRQTVISGATPAVEAALAVFEEKGVLARRLPVSAAFHSKVVEAAVPLFRRELEARRFRQPQVPVPANLRGEWYPQPGDAVSEQELARRFQELLSRQVVSPVDFIDQVERAWERGVRTFVEVGPKNVLSRLIGEILAGRPHRCLALDHPQQDARVLLGKAMAELCGTADPPANGGLDVQEKIILSGTSDGVTPSGSHLETAVLEVIEEISGYPKSMIGPDTDLEGELGIDTLKIFEIASRLKTRFGKAGGGRRRLDLSMLRTYRSILEVIRAEVEHRDASTASGGSGGTGGAGAETTTPSGRRPASGEHTGVILDEGADRGPTAHADAPSIARYLLSDRRRAAGDRRPGILPKPGSAIVVRSSGVAEFDAAVVGALSKRGFPVRLWMPEPADFDRLEAGKVPEVLAGITGYLHPMPHGRFSRKTRKTFYREEILSLLLIARAIGKDLELLLALTDLGGDLSTAMNDPSGAGFLTGVLPGFCEALAKDFPDLAARAVDLPGFRPEFAEAAILTGLAAETPAYLGLVPDGTESLPALVRSALAVAPEQMIEGLRRSLHPGVTMLVTGAAGGITAGILRRLARECRPRMILLGRAESRPDLVNELRGLGSDVWYIACDLADGPAVDRVGELIRKSCPRIDLLLHGAGIEISRHLGKKTPEEIDKIYRVKVAGLVNLLDAIGEERIDLVVNFSTVSSIFGNPGQVDYAAANGFLNRFRGKGRARFLTIAWSAWDKVGMVGRGPVHEILRAHGVEFISPEVGERFFLEELYQAMVGDPQPWRTVSIHGRLGAIMNETSKTVLVQESTQDVPAAPPSLATQAALAKQTAVQTVAPQGTDPDVLPVADHQKTSSPAMEIGTFVLRPDLEPLLKDHLLGGRCLVPAVVALAGVAGVQGRGLPESVRRGLVFESVSFLTPVKIAEGEAWEFRVMAERSATQTAEAGFEVVARPVGGDERRQRVQMSGIARWCAGGESGCDQAATVDDLARLRLLTSRDVFFRPLSRKPIPGNDLYRILFHGPAFQALESVERWNRDVLVGTPRLDPDAGRLPQAQGEFWPALVESALHAAGTMCLLRVMARGYFLPSSFQHLEVDTTACRQPDGAKVFAEYLGTSRDENGPVPLLFMDFHVTVIDRHDRPLVRIRGLRMVAGQDEPEDKRTFLSYGVPFEVGGQSLFVVADADAEQVLKAPEDLGRVLSSSEKSILASFSTPKRRREWLAGRICGKLLVQDAVRRMAGFELELPQFTVLSGEAAPVIRGEPGLPSEISSLLGRMRLSLSHAAGAAVALIGEKAVGIDLEAWRPLPDQLRSQFLAPGEAALIGEDGEVALWTAKEAVAKALGQGFQIGDFARIVLRGFGFNEPYEAECDGRVFRCLTCRDSAHVLTLATDHECDHE